MRRIFCTNAFFLLAMIIELQACRDGWLYWSKSCYLVSERPEVYASAFKFCEVHNSTLVDINSESENTFIYEKFVSKPHFRRHYIGIVRKREGKYEFVTSEGKPLDYTNWGRGEPNDLYGEEDCVEMRKKIWNDIPCYIKRPFICEYKVTCKTMPCQNGGKCIDLPKENPDPYKCQCQDPFYGSHCERKFKGCPVGWVAFGHHCYRAEKGARPWINARTFCQKKDADLPVIQSQAENTFLQKTFSKNSFWIGVISCLGGNKCTASYGPLKYTNWAASEPKQLGGNVKSCAVLAKDNGQWYDQNCEDNKYFVCIKENLDSVAR